jgi:hypothetical protein
MSNVWREAVATDLSELPMKFLKPLTIRSDHHIEPMQSSNSCYAAKRTRKKAQTISRNGLISFAYFGSST